MNSFAPPAPPEILHELECFKQMGSVLYIAAHPDDENTELLGYLSRGRNYRTAYLSLTRGDGGQNVLGSDLREKLGVARTQELMAARHIDGARQYFSRAVDFGFSKSYQETLNVWDEQEVLSDVVRVIRQFRPDVLITRFSPSPGGTHGHHTAATVLALKAFKIAGDPKMFPEQHLPPWQPRRILWNVSTFQKEKITSDPVLKIDAGGRDPVSGETFSDIAGESRAMHKTQGFDQWKAPGGLERTESFQFLDGEPVSKDIMDGVDTSWDRIPNGGNAVEAAAKAIIAAFDPKNPAASVPALLKLRTTLADLKDVKDNSVIAEKRALLDRILQGCLGLTVETVVKNSDVVPGEPMKLHHTATVHAALPAGLSVKWLGAGYPEIKKTESKDIILADGKEASWDSVETLPPLTPFSQPYWLRTEGTAGTFHVDDAKLIGTPENSPTFPLENIFEIGGQRLTIKDAPVEIISHTLPYLTRRTLDAIPPVSLEFLSDVLVLTSGATKTVEVQISAYRTGSKGTLKLNAPAGWLVEPAQQNFDLAKVGDKKTFPFTITAPAKPSNARVGAIADIDGVQYRINRQEINYAHLGRQLIQAPAVVHTVCLNLEKKGSTIGYIAGAGDSLAEAARQIGYTVKMLDDATLSAEQLQGLDAVVIGVRAFNVRKNMATAMPLLLRYVDGGGTVIAQYNRPDKLLADRIAPYPIHISADRVTDEKAAVTFVAPDSPLLNAPNKLSAADFDNWVQERGLYFPNSWDEHFVPVLSFNDPGESPMKGSLLVANYGKGYYIYTGLSLFRQLPAGVPGAYRLYANMLSIGK